MRSSAYIYIYIYVFAIQVNIYIYIYCRVKAGPRFGGLCVKNWSKSCVKNWSKFFFFLTVFPPPPFYSVWGACLKTQIVSHCAKIVFFCKVAGMSKMRFSRRKLHFCFLLCWRNRNQIKRKKQNGKGPKTYKIRVF